MENTTLTAGLTDRAPRYDVILCDIWGVVHNGVAAHPEAVEALVNFRVQGGSVILVSNAPVPSGSVIAMLNQLNVDKDAYDGVVTSGDMTRELMMAYQGQTVLHIGPDQDEPLFEGSGVIRGSLEDAVAIILSDLPDHGDKPEDFKDTLQLWLAKDLPVICANPDKVVEVGDQLIYCAGSVADLYEQIGGKVLQAGKPHAPIYTRALELAKQARGAETPLARVLAIGDSVRTDATGAANFGVDFLFITGSIHADELDAYGTPAHDKILDLVAPSRATLVGYLPRLAW